MNTLKTIVSKLNKTCHDALGYAANLCVSRSHYNIEIEHWFISLLGNKDAKITKMLHADHCDIDKLIYDLNQRLERLKFGNEQTPAMSNRLVELINEAWLMTSLDYQEQYVDSGILLCTLLQSQTLQQVASAISQEFNKVSLERLKESMLTCSQEASSDSNSHVAVKKDALTKYTVNLNAQAKAGKIDTVIGREEEVRQMIDVLSRRRQNNVILTGDPGVGKTAIVEGLALKIVEEDIPENLKNTVIYALDIGALQAGASVKGEFEKRLKQLIDEVNLSQVPIILFFDEAHSLIGAGGQAGQNDAANLLKPALARGELRAIAATTWSEYKQYFEKDAALTRRFQVIKVDEPSTNIAIKMLRSLADSLQKHHDVFILDNAIEQAVLLSERYIPGRKLPDKGISVLDTACARVAGKLKEKPIAISKNEKEIKSLNDEICRLKQEEKQGIYHRDIKTKEKQMLQIEKENHALHLKWQAEKVLITKIIALRVKLEDLDLSQLELLNIKKTFNALFKKLKKQQKDNPLLQPFVDEQVVSEVISDWTGIPTGNIFKDQATQLYSLPHRLSSRIIGQDYAVQTMSEIIKASNLKLTDPNKPLGIFLLVGPSGVGKTETALALSELLFGSKDKTTIINMSEFKEAHKASTLAGAPPGYVGYGEGGVLTEAVRRNPYCLILLDEMEKAHVSMQDIFYQVFDKGILKDGQGRDISFKNTVIVMTSNACSERISTICASEENKIEGAALVNQLEEELLKTFKPAFLGRVNIIPYLPLVDQALQTIVGLKLKIVSDRIQAQYQIEPMFSENYILYMLNSCRQHMIGARLIDNMINQQLLPEFSNIFINSILNKKKIKEILIDYEPSVGLFSQVMHYGK